MSKMTEDSQPDDERLYQLPEVCRELAEAGVNAGLARSAQEYWTYTVGPGSLGPDEGPLVLELIVAGVINANPSPKDDARTLQQRFNQAMDALLRAACLGSAKSMRWYNCSTRPRRWPPTPG